MKDYFGNPKEPLFVAGEYVEFKMHEYDFDTRLTKDVWVKAKIQVCYYFKNCVRIYYFRPQDGQIEYREIEFSSLRKIDGLVEPPLGLMPECIWIEKRIDEIDAAIKRYSAAKKHIPISWIAEQYGLKQKLAKDLDLHIWSEDMKEKDITCPPMELFVNGVKYTPDCPNKS